MYYLCFDISAVFVMAALITAVIVRKLTKGRSNHLFLMLCIFVGLSGVLDVATEWLDNLPNLTDYYTMLRHTLNTLYFAVRNFCVPAYIIYVISVAGLWERFSRRSALFYMCTIPYAIDVVLFAANIFNRKIFYFDENLNYCHGPLIVVIYVIAFYYMILGEGLLIKYRYLVTLSHFMALISFIPLSAVTVIIQIFSPHRFRVEIFGSALLAVAIAISVHRPEEMMDDVVGCQNNSAFHNTVRVNFAADTLVNYLLINIDEGRVLRNTIGLDNFMLLLRTIAGKLEQINYISGSGSEIFYLDQGSFAAMGDYERYEEMLDAGRTIMAYLMEPIKLHQMEVRVHPRICLLTCPGDFNSETEFLNFAGSFTMKIPDENRVVCLKQIGRTRDFRIRNSMDHIIQDGIANHNFEMYYQPIYSTNEKKFVSAEALIRLKDPEFGFISPAIFIPAAEESGAIHNIGDYVIDEVCRFIGSTDFEALGLKYIEINLSVAQCIESDLFEKIDDCMKKYGVRADQLNLEITETAVDYDPMITDANIRKLSAAGLTFSLDDYGTGYSNITRVVELPLEIVKLDKSLVDDMDTHSMWIVITKTVSMLKRMNKKILVEGVEDERALKRFMDIGCDYIQGYYFSKPIPENEFKEFVRKNNFEMAAE